MLHTVRIVLLEPSHPGNIGATARAMKTMGLRALYLVRPKQFPHQEASVRASGAGDILEQAIVTDTLAAAIGDCQWVFGASARPRHLPWPSCTPRACAEQIGALLNNDTVAILFGRESSGLTNEELSLCHYQICIPTHADSTSLNLAAAVQVIAYELFMAHSQQDASLSNKEATASSRSQDIPATIEQTTGFLQHLESLLTRTAFLDAQRPLLLRRLHRLFLRAQLEEKEVHILRGILTAIEKQLPPNPPHPTA